MRCFLRPVIRQNPFCSGTRMTSAGSAKAGGGSRGDLDALHFDVRRNALSQELGGLQIARDRVASHRLRFLECPSFGGQVQRWHMGVVTAAFGWFVKDRERTR